MSFRKPCKRDIAFEGTQLPPPPFAYSPKLPSIFIFSVVRSGKADAVKAAYTKYGDQVDIVVVDDFINGDFTDALKGVYAIILVASPLPGRQDLRATIDVSPSASASRHIFILLF